MRVGFTGSRRGMSYAQTTQFVKVLARFFDGTPDGNEGRNEFHHGDGYDEKGGLNSADRQAAQLAKNAGWDVIPHPPTDLTAEAMLERNRVVVANGEILIAAPETNKEVLRSGTWATMRYAWADGKPVIQLARGKA